MPGSPEWRSFQRQVAELSVDGLSVSEFEPLAPHTTLRIGGPARLLVRCASRGAVAAAVRAAGQARIPWLVLGLGANVLVPDAGLDAAVLMLVDELAAVAVDGTRLRAGGGAQLGRAVRAALDAGLAGIECLGGIPSTIGGALAMNAGAYGQEILNVVDWAEVVEEGGDLRRLERREIEGGYRWSVLGVGRVVTSAELALKAEDPAALRERARQARERRRGVLPPEPSAGSVFRNPAGDFAGRLLELAGCKGMRSGGAEVSERHANVIVNPGGATAAGVRELVAAMAGRVRERFGVHLELELKVLDRNGKAVADPEAPLA
ncbi:MAG: UDP-N-acetylmuramate dehydrogenase [Thermoanaerobaculaceae bacterium]|nr:UDP-N-acetylmuramate dehydrogenase [Thermoanaerobaculaceae bacterium]TAM45524.1 MAG: UDP-N-acetylmuramate dehydrogenase [Acidobacteriota bacterium]